MEIIMALVVKRMLRSTSSASSKVSCYNKLSKLKVWRSFLCGLTQHNARGKDRWKDNHMP